MKAKFKNSQEIAKEEQSWEMGVGVGGSCTIRCQNFVIKIQEMRQYNFATGADK